jgi:hypothetical protein
MRTPQHLLLMVYEGGTLIRHEEQQSEYEPPAIIEYGDWSELTQHADPLSSASHPALDHQLGSSITPHH